MKKFKKSRLSQALPSWIVVFALTIGFIPPAFAADNRIEDSPYNIALLIDKSGSMNTTDRDRLALEAAKMFIDSLFDETEEGRKDAASCPKVGVIAFGDDTETVVQPVEMSSAGVVDYVKQGIDSIKYYPINTRGTDLGLAVQSAAQMLDAEKSDSRKNIIVLFTDGFSEMVDLERSATYLKEGHSLAAKLNCEIFVIGLNYANRISQAGRKEIWSIANEAQLGDGLVPPDKGDSHAETEKVNYLITDSKREVSEFYMRLFAYIMGAPEPEPVQPETDVPISPGNGGGNNWRYYKLNVTSPGFSLVKVYIRSTDPVGEIAVWNPANQKVDYSNRIREGIGYKLLTIPQPEMGTWYLGTQKDADYDVRYVPVTGIRLDLELEKSGTSTCTATVTASYDGELLGEDFYLQVISAQCTVIPENDQEQLLYEMTYDPEKGVLSSTIDVPSPGQYMVRASIATSQLERDMEKSIQFDALGSLSIETVRQGETLTIDLDRDLHLDWKNIPIQITRVEWEPRSLINVSETGSLLEIQGLEVGTTYLTLHLAIGQGMELEIPCTVQVEPNLILWVLTRMTVFATAAIVALLLKRALQRVPGIFSVTCTLGNYAPAEDILSPRGPSFSMYKLVQSALAPASDSESVQKVMAEIDKFKSELQSDKYRIYIVRKNQRLTYRYGNEQSFLNGDIFQDIDSGLTISVVFKPASDIDSSDSF